MSRALFIKIGSLLAASALLSTALATTYVRVEKDGTKTYSDRPIPGGQPIEIQPAQTYSAPSSAPGVDTSKPREEQELMDAANFHYRSCTLSPHSDQTFTNPQEVVVSLSLNPALRIGDSVKLSVDGTALPGGGGDTTASIPQPERGSHTVTARVTDGTGKSVCDASSTFHVMRPTTNSPTRIPPRLPPRPTPH
jgi:hypothetical protein